MMMMMMMRLHEGNYDDDDDDDQCGENCTGMRAMPVGKLSKTGRIKESYQNIYGQIIINVENPKSLISFSSI